MAKSSQPSKPTNSSPSPESPKSAEPLIAARRMTRAPKDVVLALNGEPARGPVPHQKELSRRAVCEVGVIPEDALRECLSRNRPEPAAPFPHAIHETGAVADSTDDLTARARRRSTSRSDRPSDDGGHAAPSVQPRRHEPTTDAAVFGVARMVPAGDGRVEMLLRLVQTLPMYAIDGHLEMCEVEDVWRIPAAQVDQDPDKDCFARLVGALDAVFLRIVDAHCANRIAVRTRPRPRYRQSDVPR
ncbi:hypothetical protein [Cupriavidus metallidurans]|uniref:hypothetical protein n=1 Tax=Cupriavidus metallidurans TaxID=119219 RepID=UPI001CCE0857|nr:hypothetical protein [Cupriavidus metallidurans]UBM09393.1 hypothetical protein LAI70_05735 [Cupriavidus metallidurans]